MLILEPWVDSIREVMAVLSAVVDPLKAERER